MFVVDGHRFDDLSLDTIDQLERETKKRWFELVRTPKGMVAVAAVLVGDRAPTVDLERFRQADDDRPSEYQNGIPVMGGRTVDEFVVKFGKPPWCWPPDVTRRQSLRDLLVLADSVDSEE